MAKASLYASTIRRAIKTADFAIRLKFARLSGPWGYTFLDAGSLGTIQEFAR